MGKMLSYFSAKRNMDRDEAMYWAIGLIVSLFFGTMVSHHLFHYLMHVGIKMSVACSSLLYKKMLRLSMTGDNDQTTVGQVSNCKFFQKLFVTLKCKIWVWFKRTSVAIFSELMIWWYHYFFYQMKNLIKTFSTLSVRKKQFFDRDCALYLRC